MTLRIEVLGSEPAWPSASLACSGYLVQTGKSTTLVDCGPGVFARLRSTSSPEALTAIVISHLHFDHWTDLIPFRYYLEYEARPESSPRLYLPPGAIEKLQKIADLVDPCPGFFTGTFETSEYDPRESLRVEDLEISFYRTRHPVETYALRLTSGRKTLAYSADTGWVEDIVDLARDADLFLCEATWGAGEGPAGMHLSASEAGRLAARAGARSLLLTHLAEREAAEAVRAARIEYGGPLDYAAAGTDLTL